MRKYISLTFVLFILPAIYSEVYYINATAGYYVTNLTSSPTYVPVDYPYTSYGVISWENNNLWVSGNNAFFVQLNLSIDPNIYDVIIKYGGINITASSSGGVEGWVNNFNDVYNYTFACGITSSGTVYGQTDPCSVNNFNLSSYLRPGDNMIIMYCNAGSTSTPYCNFYLTLPKGVKINNNSNIPVLYANITTVSYIYNYTNNVSTIYNTSFYNLYNYSSSVYSIYNASYIKTIQSDLIITPKDYSVTSTNNSKTTSITVDVSGSQQLPILLVAYLVTQDNNLTNITDYAPTITVNNVNYGNTPIITFMHQPPLQTYSIQITDYYPSYKTLVFLFAWNPNQTVIVGIAPLLGTYTYQIGQPKLLSYTKSVSFIYGIPLYIFPKRDSSNPAIPVLINIKQLSDQLGMNLSSQSFIVMRYDPITGSFSMVPYFVDPNIRYPYALMFIKVPEFRANIPVILYIFVTDDKYSNFEQPNLVFKFFVNFQIPSYYSLINLYTTSGVTYTQTPLGLLVNLNGGTLSIYP
ncbi:MAG: hypothetical protein ACP5GJ_02695 [Nanopusillaceae archaeon]